MPWSKILHRWRPFGFPLMMYTILMLYMRVGRAAGL
jgi:hypothetical protein